MTPHMANELLEVLLSKKLQNCPWPTFDPKLASLDEITISIQVNAKHRGTIEIAKDATQKEVEHLARHKVEKWLEGQEITRVIFVPGRTINFIFKK